MLEARDIRYIRDGQVILDGISFAVPAGQSLAVTGPSGSGKTSLLAILSGLAPPTSGQVCLEGKPLTGFTGPSAGVALVLQGYGLVSLLTAAENIEAALRAAGGPARTAQPAAQAALENLGLGAHAGQLVEQLSGGQQQRVAVARALALQPRLLIADEPTAELDPAARALVLTRILAITATGGSVILATHDPEVAERTSQILDLRVMVLPGHRDLARYTAQRLLSFIQANQALWHGSRRPGRPPFSWLAGCPARRCAPRSSLAAG